MIGHNDSDKPKMRAKATRFRVKRPLGLYYLNMYLSGIETHSVFLLVPPLAVGQADLVKKSKEDHVS